MYQKIVTAFNSQENSAMIFQNKTIQSFVFAAFLAIFMPILGAPDIFLGATSAQAQTVSRIDISGNARVDDNAIISLVKIGVGQNASSAAISRGRDALYDSGLFSDVSVSRSGSVLQIVVAEHPVISGMRYLGNVRFSDDQLSNMLQLRPRSVYTNARLDADIQTIRDAYAQSGFSVAAVTADVEAQPDNQVRVTFNVADGDRSGIASISFIGNKAFGDSRLRNEIRTHESNLLSFLTADDNYDKDKTDVDEELLRRFYAQNGYPDMRVISTVADFNVAQNKYYITFTVDEGEEYRFGSISVETSLNGIDVNVLSAQVSTRSGSLFNNTQLQDTVADLSLAAVNQGFSFAEARSRVDRDFNSNLINVTYLVDEGARVYIERINIYGNTRTRDFVIRRELDFVEGDPFNRALVRKAKTKLDNTGFFKSVNFGAQPGSSDDRVIVNITVEDQATGEFGASIGYSSKDGIIGELSIVERNFLGRGQYVKASVGASDTGRNFNFSFREPYIAGLRISAGFDVYGSRDKEELGVAGSYGKNTTGVRLTSGLPILDDLTLNSYVGFETNSYTDANNDSTVDPVSGKYDKAFVGYSLDFNSLDNRIAPTSGTVASFSQEYAGFGSTADYLRTQIRVRHYQELFPEADIIGSIKAQAGFVTALNSGGVVVQQEMFFKGQGLVRGFKQLGPMSAAGVEMGGTTFYGISAEIEMPIPILPRQFGVSTSIWADAGTLYGTEGVASFASSDSGKIRASVGASLIWRSPLGPLRVDFAEIISQEAASDTTENIQFSISSVF